MLPKLTPAWGHTADDCMRRGDATDFHLLRGLILSVISRDGWNSAQHGYTLLTTVALWLEMTDGHASS
jgi:hypothetical protein